MSLHPEKIGVIPDQTAHVAKACFPKGNRYIRLRDVLGTIFDDNEFADLFPRRGQPAEARFPIGTGLSSAVHRRDRKSVV